MLQSPQGVRVTVDGRAFLAFCSNDYLGLASDPELIAAARRGAEAFGVGAGASHLVLGHCAPHQDVEQALGDLKALRKAPVLGRFQRPRDRRWDVEAAFGDLAFSPDGRVLAVGDRRGEVQLWHTTSGRRLAHWQVEPGRERHDCSVTFSPDGRRLAFAQARPTTSVEVVRLPVLRRYPRPDLLPLRVGQVEGRDHLRGVERPRAADLDRDLPQPQSLLRGEHLDQLDLRPHAGVTRPRAARVRSLARRRWR